MKITRYVVKAKDEDLFVYGSLHFDVLGPFNKAKIFSKRRKPVML